MSNNKRKKKKAKHGGARPGAGHPETGVTKAKICVSVNEENWKTALKRWRDKGSRLVNWLIEDYLERSSSQPTGAV